MKKNLITVLKKLLKAFGGDDESVKNNAVDIIDKIADNASSSGGGNVVVLETEEYDSGFCTKNTWQEIYDLMQAGTVVYLNFSTPSFNPDSEYYSNNIVQVALAQYMADYYPNPLYHYFLYLVGDSDTRPTDTLCCATATDHPYWVPD